MQDIRGSRKGKLEVGVDIPREEIKSPVAALDKHWRPLLVTAIFTSMRSSELRGLRLQNENFTRGEINVNQRASRRRQCRIRT